MKQNNYQISDLVRDDSFKNWLNKSSKEDVVRWQNWVNEHPDHAALAEDAVLLLKGIRFEKALVDKKVIDNEWLILQTRIKNSTFNNTKPSRTTFLGFQYYVVALLIGLLMGGAILWSLNHISDYTIYSTAFGENAKFMLPDSSEVALHGNTSLRFSKNWLPGKDREVWLDGEAYFSVLHNEKNDRFIVYLNNGVQLEVLGTEFNVISRKELNRVVLSSGALKMNLSSASPSIPSDGTSVTIKPGEMIEYGNKPVVYTKKTVNPELYTAWKDNRFLFDDTTLAEIAIQLETNYGYKVQIKDKDLASRKLTGEIETDDPETLLYALATSFNIGIQKDNKELTFYSKK